MKANKYIYHRDNVWGIKVGPDKREWIRAGPASWLSISYFREFQELLQIQHPLKNRMPLVVVIQK